MNQSSQFWSAIDPRNFSQGLWRSTGWLAAGNIVIVVLALLRLPVLTRILSKDEVGMLALVAAMIPFAALLSMSGMDQAAYHYIAKGKRGAYRAALRVRLKWSLLASLMLLVCAAYWLVRDTTTLAWLFTVAAFAFPATSGMVSEYVLQAAEKFKLLFWYRTANALSSYVGFAVLLLLPLLADRVVWFSFANKFALAALQVTCAFLIIWVMRRERVPALSTEDRREMVRYGRHQTALNAIITVQTRVDAILVGWLLPLAAMADYSIALLIADQFKRLWVMYYAVRYPPLVRMPLALRRARLMFEATAAVGIFFVLAAVAGAVSWWLIPVILPADYASSRPLMLVLLGAFVAGVPGLFADVYFRSQQNERAQYVMRGIGGVSGVVLPAVLMLFFGVFGVALGRLAAAVVNSVAGTVLFLRDSDGDVGGTASVDASSEVGDEPSGDPSSDL